MFLLWIVVGGVDFDVVERLLLFLLRCLFSVWVCLF